MYTLANMQDSIKKVEATRAQRMATEPRRMYLTTNRKITVLCFKYWAVILFLRDKYLFKII